MNRQGASSGYPTAGILARLRTPPRAASRLSGARDYFLDRPLIKRRRHQDLFEVLALAPPGSAVHLMQVALLDAHSASATDSSSGGQLVAD